ncbi:MAG: hypothetical protein DRO18_02245, partial [Thermoprotei archaeon]
NDANESISDVQACFYLPNGFSISGGTTCVDATTLNGTYKRTYAPGEIFRVEARFNVDKSVKPKRYYFEIHVLYSVNVSRYEEVVFVPVDISPYPGVNVSVIEVWWDSEHVYPGTTGATLNLMIKNVGNISIRGGDLRIILPKNITPRTIRSSLGALDPNSTITLSFNNIDIPLNVKPGNYTSLMKLNVTAVTEDGVDYYTYYETRFNITISKPRPLMIRVIDAFWVGYKAYGKSKELSLRLTLQNLDLATINTLIANLSLPPGMSTVDSRNYVVASIEGFQGHGSIFTLTFSGINVSDFEILKAKFNASLEILATYRGAEFRVEQPLTFRVRLVNESIISLISHGWLYNGRPASALPSSRDITLELTLINLGTSAITSVSPEVHAPKGFKLKSISGSCITTGIQAGRTCTLDLTFDIDKDVRPGTYTLNISLNYMVSSGNALLFSSTTLRTKVIIENPRNYLTSIKLGRVWWGTARPTTAYPGSRIMPLHVEIINVGRENAQGVYVNVKPLTNDVRTIEGSGLCSSNLPSGSSCTFTAYLDLGKVSRSIIPILINVNYSVNIYGAKIYGSEDFTVTLPVETYAALLKFKGVEIIDWGWLNNRPVFPGTENATYTITIVNHYPYSIESLDLTLILPDGFLSKYGRVSKGYYAGPLDSNQEITINVPITVKEWVKPGRYEINLTLTYVVNTGGASIIESMNLSLPLIINRLSRGLEFIVSGWSGATAEPMTYGNTYFLVLRNVDFPEIRGVVADMELPKGIVSSLTNSSKIKIYPSVPPPTQVSTAPLGRLSPEEIARLVMSAYGGATAQAIGQTFSRGDLIFFATKLNILNISPGTYYANVTISFIDHWGTLRYYKVKVPIVVLGTSKIVRIWSESTLRFVNRQGKLDLNIVNVGTSPIYNVYIAVYSKMPYVVVSQPILYFDSLPPNEVTKVKLPVYFNPIPMQGAPIPITYGSIPFIASVMFTDVSGFRHSFNTSFAVTLEPYIEISLSEVKVTYEGGKLRASGTITNLGNAKAERVTVYLIVSSRRSEESFVGDIDPSSQASFSVYIENIPPVSNVTIVVRYRNPFNEVLEYREVYGVELITPTPTTTPKPGFLGMDFTTRLIIIGLVGMFLVLVALAIRSYLKKHSALPQIEGLEGA